MRGNIIAFLKSERDKLNQAIHLLDENEHHVPGRKRRHMSAEAKRRISDAQKKALGKSQKEGRVSGCTYKS